MTHYRIGIDMGGTFTDSFLLADDGTSYVAKVDTRPDDLLRTTSESLDQLGAQVGLSTEELLPRVTRFALGTTLTTNLLVTRSGSPAGFVTTRGHGDVLHIAGGTQGKIAGLSDEEIRHSFTLDRPEPLVPKRAIVEIDERVDRNGDVLVALDEDGVRAAALRLEELGIRAVGIGFLWSFRNPAHELRAGEIFAEVAPEVDVTLSHALVSRMGEYLRFSSAAINAYCAPVLRAYMESQAAWLRERGLTVEPLVMQATGGAIPASAAARTGVFTVDSGPVAGVVGASELGTSGQRRNIICTDMGGTTFDVGLVGDGAPVMTGRGVAVRYPFVGQIVDISSIGSGGGSIAWVDDALGILKVGPQSAGANPGPASYGRGGTLPTVSDANIVLGYLDPGNFLGGAMTLDASAAERAIDEHVATPLGMSVVEAAQAIFTITNGHMADFLRQKTIENGYDPRTFDLFAYGGAGPVHATAFARELGVRGVVVPLGNVASVYSALGVLTADIRHVHEHPAHEVSSPRAPGQAGRLRHAFDGARLGETLRGLEERARAELREEGVADADMRIRYSVDLRYMGQIAVVELPLEEPPSDDTAAADALATFHRRYEELYGQGSANQELPVELLMVRVTALGVSEPMSLGALADGESDASTALKGRRVVVGLEGARETDVYDGHQLGTGAEIAGPAIVEMDHTTLVLHAGDRATWAPGGTIDVIVPSTLRADPEPTEALA